MTRYDVATETGTNGANVASGDSPGLTVSKSGTAGPPALTYSTTQAAHGSKSIRVVTGAGDTAILIVQPLSGDRAVARMYLRVDALPTVFTQLIALRHSAGNMCIVGLDASGRVSVQGAGGAAIANDTNPIPVNTWVRIELGAIKGTTTTDGRVVAAWYTGDSTTANWSLDNAATNAGTADVANVRFAKPNSGGAYSGYVDDAAAADGTITLLGPAGNVAPVANAGADQTISAGANLVLAGSGSDADGTIASYAWTQVSGPAVTLTGANTATAGVTAIGKGHYVFRLTVTDDAGGTGTDDVTVNVKTTTARPDSLISNAGAFTILDGAASIVAGLADESDTTGALSPDNPSGAVLEYGVEPLEPGAVTVSYRLRANTSSPARSVLTELRMGSTVIASQTDTPTTTATTFSFVLDAGQLTALTGRTDLRIRHTVS